MVRLLTLAFTFAVICLQGVGAAFAQASTKPLSVIVFPGGFNWPIWVAQEKGFFERSGIAVTVTPTPNSVFQLTGPIDGRFDIAHTAIDNVVAYMEGQGEAPTQATPDLTVFMGGDNGFLRLVAVPEVKTFADLKGKELSVDALTTGYAFVLRKLLEKSGLTEGEFALVRAGGVLQRFEALLEKKHAALALRGASPGARLHASRERDRHARPLPGPRRRRQAGLGPRTRERTRRLYARLSGCARLAL